MKDARAPAAGIEFSVSTGAEVARRILPLRLPFGASEDVQVPMPPTSDKRKQSLYFPEEILKEIQEEAIRQDRSLSWIVQQAWKSARGQIAKMPGMDDLRRPPPPPAKA